jgi:hypothetical protein
MKTGCRETGALFLTLWVIVGSACSLKAQLTVQLTNVFAPAAVVTTGGITYAEYGWVVSGCGEMNSMGPLIRNGTNFSFDFDYENVMAEACPNDVFEQSASIVLGALAPGTYALTTTSWGVPVGTTNFTVPTLSTQTLQPLGFSTNGSFQIQLNGVPYIGYVLQSSTDLVSWTSLSTNLIGQPLADIPSSSPNRRFYRVQIPDTVAIGSGIP